MAIAGCSDPLREVPRLSDVAVDGPAPVVEAVADPVETDAQAGFFQRLLRKRDVGPGNAVPDAETEAVARGETNAEIEVISDGDAGEEAAAGGLFGRLFGGDRPRAPEGAEAPEGVERVALARPAEGESASQGGRGGLFGARKATGPDAAEALPGEVLGFGEVARACHARRGDLGLEVGKFPEKRAKYRVYDSDPGHPGLNTFYITGFADGCPRQVTAALAVFGSPGMYEALRYGLPESARTGRETDRAYERVKSRVCGVSRNRPCGAKLDRIERDTVFLSLYNRFEGASGWINILIHDGEMLAMAPGG